MVTQWPASQTGRFNVRKGGGGTCTYLNSTLAEPQSSYGHFVGDENPMLYRESSGDGKTISTTEISARKPGDVWPERSFKFRRKYLSCWGVYKFTFGLQHIFLRN